MFISKTQVELLHCGPVHSSLDSQHVELLFQAGSAVTHTHTHHKLFFTQFLRQIYYSSNMNKITKRNRKPQPAQALNSIMSIFLNLHKYLSGFHCGLNYCRNFFITHFNLSLVHWLSLPNRKDDTVEKKKIQLIKMLFNSSGNQSDKQHETPRWESTVCVCVCVS